MTNFDTVVRWFSRAADTAAAAGKKDSAALWRDGLEQLRAHHDVVAEVVSLRAMRQRIQAASLDRGVDDAQIKRMNTEYERRFETMIAQARGLVADDEIELPEWL